jgi:hypothetical protein
MKKVYSIDNNLIKRTKKWLFNRRDGKGGFLINDNKKYQFVKYINFNLGRKIINRYKECIYMLGFIRIWLFSQNRKRN